MDLREHPRLGANLIPVQVTGLEDLPLRTSGRIINVSRKGLRLQTAEPISPGAFLRLDFDDATIFAETRYCRLEDDGYAVGLFVEEVLVGTSDLARLVASLAGAEGRKRHHSHPHAAR